MRHAIRHRTGEPEPADPTPAAWLKFGQRNILYIGFLALLVPFAMALDGRQPPGAQSLGGFGFALTLSAVVSAAFFLLNAGLALFELANGRRAAKTLIGCLLPLAFGAGIIVAREFAS